MPYKMITRALALAGTLAATPVFAIDLMGVHNDALASDPVLQAASYRRDATGENRSIARANLLPQLSGSAGATQGESQTDVAGDRVADNDIDNENWRLDLNQVVYDHGNYKLLDIAKAQVAQGEAIYDSAYQNFLVRVSVAYFDVLSALDGVTFAEAEERALQRQFEQAEQRFEVGLTAVTDVHEARASYDQARARAIVSRNRLMDSREALRELTGHYYEELDRLQPELPLVSPDPNDPEGWVDVAVNTNPAVVSARYAVDIADANALLQRSGHYPTLNFNASYQDFTNHNFQLTVGGIPTDQNVDLEATDLRYSLRLNVPIYAGGRVSSNTRQARYQLNATQQDLDYQLRLTARQTRDAYRAIIAGIQQVQAFQQAEVSAESALEATQAGFEVGTRTIVDVLLAQQRRFGAQRENSAARHLYVLDHLRLKAAAGILSVEDLQAVNQILE
jgi:outer membrane protein